MTDRNRPLSSADSALRSIQTIASWLKNLDHEFKAITEIEDSIQSLVQAKQVAFYRRHYHPGGTYVLKRLRPESSASGQDSPLPESIQPAAYPEDVRRALVTNSPGLMIIPQSETLRWATTSCIYPLFLENDPFGILLIAGLDTFDLEPLQSLCSSICTTLELSLSGINMRKRFDDVFNSFPHPSFIMAADEKIVSWNRANELMTGVSASDIIGKGRYSYAVPYYGKARPLVPNLMIHPDPAWLETYFEYSREGDHVNALAFCPALPGGRTFLRTHTTKLHDLNNKLCGAIHTVRDVTLERQMQKNLQRSETMYQAIADFAGVGILLVRDNEIIYINEQAEEFIGRSHTQTTFIDFISWVKLQDFENVGVLIGKLSEEKQGPVRFTFEAERNGTLCFFNALAQLISYENEDVVYLVIDDVTEQKELDRRARLNELKLFHEERLTSLGMMAAGIAHELNQPLNTIRVITDGFLYCDEKGWGMDRDELRDNIEMISRQVLRMSTVIQNIRNFARDDQSEEFTDVNINDAVETVFSMIGRQLEAHNIQVDKTLKAGLPPIMAPANQLEQVVTNLLINARQAFDSSNRGNCHIKVETDMEGKDVCLRISDNATGVSEEHIEKIFYPFFTTKEVGKGTGLGLSICQTIVASMKGKLDVYNNDQGGATFVVSIPLQEISHEYSRNR